MDSCSCFPFLSLFWSTNTITVNGHRYTLIKQLGEGGQAVVWLAEDEVGQYVAVKRITCIDSASKKLALLEMEIFKKFDHPHILKMYDAAIMPSTRHSGAEEVVLILEYYPKGSLQDLIEKYKAEKRQLNETAILRMFIGICEAVQLFHEHSPPLAHRDIKPHNILLDRDNTPVLMDFGSVTQARRPITSRQDELEIMEEAERHTTPSYRAPELFDRGVGESAPINEKIDIWALGCMLYAMAFLENPFDAAVERGGNLKLAVLDGRINFPTNHPYSKGLCDLIQELLTVDPVKRPSISETISKARDLLSGDYKP